MRSIITNIIIYIFLLCGTLTSFALSPDFYANSSRLSSGNWAKVEVTQTGMQLIPNATLRALGFSDPSKVNVYGSGGRILPERLYNSMTDDLPLLPSVVTSEGILFFGHNNISWTASVSNPGHKMNPYSEHSYYFISDREEVRPELSTEITGLPSSDNVITGFTRRLLHENDLLAPYDSGRQLLGEDFRTQPRRSFSFDMPDCMGEAEVKVCFGAKVTNGSSKLEIDFGGENTQTFNIAGVSSTSTFLVMQTFKGKAPASEKLDMSIQYSNTGLAATAALDYIEVFYPSALKLRNNQLYFYIQPASPATVRIENCTDATIVWDVTIPEKPVRKELTLDGSTGVFVSGQGYHEYVAFNPSKCANTVVAAGKVRNQDLHAMEVPDMLIVTPEAYRQAAERLASLRERTDGLKCAVLTPEVIYNEFSSGSPDVTAIRKLLKMWHDRAVAEGTSGPRFCLILSRPSYDNKMVTQSSRKNNYPRIPIWQSENTFSETTSFSTDDYIGMLDDNTTALNMNNAKIHVAVGRMPVKSLAEAETAVSKLEKYLTSPSYGSWRTNVMVIADDQDNGTHLHQAEDIVSILSSSEGGKDYIYEKLYLDAFQLGYSGVGAVYPEAKTRMMEKWNEGVVWMDYIGHANPKSWGHENLLTWTDINSMTNSNLPFLYAATCEFLRWDADEVSGGEILWLTPNAGVIGMICPSRTVYITLNGLLNSATAQHVFSRNEDGSNLSVGEIMVRGKNNTLNDNNRLRYGFCGDPSMKLPSPELTLNIDRINGVETASMQQFPEIGARTKLLLEGSVTDYAGNIAEDFNGIADLRIFDAETVRTTWGNGSDGVVDTYNDRKNRLYSGRVKVENGKWTTTVFLPSEIENNYSPALISLYAYTSEGREAAGSFDKFYIYGYDTNVAEDNDGPEITEMWINSPTFADGGLVSPSSIFKASFTDPSGINVSDGGIGHNLSLSIDGTTFINDLGLYYSPDENDPTAGSVNYPLTGIQPGEHTLEFTVWDNANNSTRSTLAFKVAADWTPSITTLTTDASPATTSVNFIVATDGEIDGMECTIDVIDLSGMTVWSGKTSSVSGSSPIRISWDLSSSGGGRVARGIYLYRATITGKNGFSTSKTRKIAVAG